MTDQDPGQVMTIKRFNELRTEWLRQQINVWAIDLMYPTVKRIVFPPIQIEPSRIKAQQEQK